MLKQDSYDFVLNKFTYTALTVTLIGLPLLYVFGTDCGERSPFQILVTESARPHYWSFIFTIVFLEWIAFFAIYSSLKRNNESWKTIGLDWQWFTGNRIWLSLLLIVPLIGAYYMPGYYNYIPPDDPQFIDIGPAGSFERMFFVFASITAGICEEVIFRGYAITRLGKLLKNNWIALIISSLFFVLLHGVPESVEEFFSYFFVGILFGGIFILLKGRRLEYLILVHYLIDVVFGSFVQ